MLFYQQFNIVSLPVNDLIFNDVTILVYISHFFKFLFCVVENIRTL